MNGEALESKKLYERALHSGQVRQKPRVAVEVIAGKVHRLLVDRPAMTSASRDIASSTARPRCSGQGVARDRATFADFGQGGAEDHFIDGDAVLAETTRLDEPQARSS